LATLHRGGENKNVSLGKENRAQTILKDVRLWNKRGRDRDPSGEHQCRHFVAYRGGSRTTFEGGLALTGVRKHSRDDQRQIENAREMTSVTTGCWVTKYGTIELENRVGGLKVLPQKCNFYRARPLDKALAVTEEGG